MKIALLTEKYTPDIGGLAISSERLARLLSSVGHNVRVFSPSLNLPPSEKRTLPSSGVNITRFGAHKRVDDTLVDWFELLSEEHKRDPFDVFHAYFLTQAGFIATYAGKYLNIPSVVSIRGNDIERAPFDPSKFSHVMYALQNASAVTTNAKELAKKATAFVNREIVLIPNGVDIEHFKPMQRIEKFIETMSWVPENKDDFLSPLEQQPFWRLNPIIGFVGELRKKKGLATLLSSFVLVNKKRPMTLLITGIVRQGEDKKIFDEFVMTNPGLQIIITGYIPPNDLPNYYTLIDILVHPSLRDGMPNAILEAMACGKSVIATPVGGTNDILQDGKNGVIVNVNDPNMLAEKILELLSDSEKRSKLGKNARELVVNKFTLEKELEANLVVYKKLGLNI